MLSGSPVVFATSPADSSVHVTQTACVARTHRGLVQPPRAQNIQ